MLARLLSSATALVMLASVAPSAWAAAPPLPDAGVFTTYQVEDAGQSVGWLTCGSAVTPAGSSLGCLASGTLQPFQRVCGLLQGAARMSGAAILRDVYVLDAGGAGGAALTLSVYERSDTMTLAGDMASETLKAKVQLPIPAGLPARCSMAADARYLFIGSSASAYGVRVDKASLVQTGLGLVYPPLPIVSITADDRGYVAVVSASGTSSEYYVYGPDGALRFESVGVPALLNGRNAYVAPSPAAGSIGGEPVR